MVYLQLRSISKAAYFLLRGGCGGSSSSRCKCCTCSSIATGAHSAELPTAPAAARGSGAQRTPAGIPTSKFLPGAATRAAAVSSQATVAEAVADVQTGAARHAAAAACQSAAVVQAAAATLPKAATRAHAAADPAAAAAEITTACAVQAGVGVAVEAAAAADLLQLPLVGRKCIQRTEDCIHLLLEWSVEWQSQQPACKPQLELQRESQDQDTQAEHQQLAKLQKRTKQERQTQDHPRVLQVHGLVHREALSLRSSCSSVRGQQRSRLRAQAGRRTSGQRCAGEPSSSSSRGSSSTTRCSRAADSVRRSAGGSGASNSVRRSSIATSCRKRSIRRNTNSSSSTCDMMAGTQERSHRSCLPPPRRAEEEEVPSEFSTAAEMVPFSVPVGCVAAVTVGSCCCSCGRRDCNAEHDGATCAGGESPAGGAAYSPAVAAASRLAARAAASSSCSAAAGGAPGDPPAAATVSPSLLVVAGPSGVGKGTLTKRILHCWPNAIRFSVSHTTRAPRPGEQQGREYHFCTEQEFDALKKEGGFLESATFSGFSYGTSIAAVRSIQLQSCICLLEIDLEGVRQVQESPMAQQARFVFIQPPSLAELERRLRGRKTESEQHIQARLATAKRELSMAEKLHFDARITNADLEEAWDHLRHEILTWFGPCLRQERQTTTEPQQPLPQQQHQAS